MPPSFLHHKIELMKSFIENHLQNGLNYKLHNSHNRKLGLHGQKKVLELFQKPNEYQVRPNPTSEQIILFHLL